MNNIKNKILGSAFSKTVWFALLLMFVNWVQNNTGVIAALFPTEYNELVLYVVGGIVILFRWITTQPVEDKLPSRATDQGEDATTRLNDALANEDPNNL